MVNERKVTVLYPSGFGDGLQVAVAENRVVIGGCVLFSVGVQ